MSEPDILEQAFAKAENESLNEEIRESQLSLARDFLLGTRKVVLGKPSDKIIARVMKIDDLAMLEVMLFRSVIPRNWEVFLDQFTQTS